MSKVSLTKLSMRFGLAVATKMISCTSCGNLISKGTPFWSSTALGATHTVSCCHVCSATLFHAINNAARTYNNSVQKLNFFFGTKFKWVDMDGVCAAGHNETEIMYKDFRIDNIAWMVVKEANFYERT